MKFFKTDMKRAFTEPAFFLGIVLGTIMLFGAAAYFFISGNAAENIYSYAQSLILPFAAPILAAMPYSSMIMQERETNYIKMMKIKLRGSRYEFTRLAVCGISGAAVLVIPQAVLLAVCAAMGRAGDVLLSVKTLALSVTFGFGYAVFSYGLTFVNKQRYIPIVIPQVLYLFCVYAFPHIGLERFYPPLDISPAIYGGEITEDRFAIPAVLLLIGTVLTFSGIITGKNDTE